MLTSSDELKSYGLKVSLDEFIAATPQGEKKMANIVGEIAGETKTLILIASHYDTKYYKDMHFVGANDPAASVATLLEIGRVLGSNKEKPKFTYWLVFFDGEEAFCEGWNDCGKARWPGQHLWQPSLCFAAAREEMNCDNTRRADSARYDGL